MTAAAADRHWTDIQPGELLSVLVKASTKIFKGTAVCVDATGYAVPGADTAALIFVGWAYEQADNSSGADGAKAVRVRTSDVLPMISSGADQSWVGSLAMLVDDQTVALAITTTNDIQCGVIVRVNSATEVEVKATVIGA